MLVFNGTNTTLSWSSSVPFVAITGLVLTIDIPNRPFTQILDGPLTFAISVAGVNLPLNATFNASLVAVNEYGTSPPLNFTVSSTAVYYTVSATNVSCYGASDGLLSVQTNNQAFTITV